MSEQSRTIETQIEIDAPVDAVWAALSESEELANWFPIKARVKPGAGGSVWSWWADDMQWESPIAAWEPNRHMRVVWLEPGEYGEMKVPFQIAVDYTLETRAGKTVLRLVHSGFSTDTAWDNLQWSDQLAEIAAHTDAVCFGTLGQRSDMSRSVVRLANQVFPFTK